jgi:HipA-like C-terminal domain
LRPRFSIAIKIGRFNSAAFTTEAVGRRWSDPLVAEHLAHGILRGGRIPAAQSEIHQFGGVTFLQVERFDRLGLNGRVGVTSLLAIDTTQYGILDSWIASAMRLHRAQRIDVSTLEMVRMVFTFDGLIANTDRHFGNLAMFDRYDGRFRLAPGYDMLPMLYAPQNDEIMTRVFQPPDPTSENLTAYRVARELAQRYWRLVADDRRVSTEFRTIADACGRTLAALPRTGAYAYLGGSALKATA